MKKIKIKKELAVEKSADMFPLQRRHTVMEGATPEDVWDSRKPFSRSSSTCDPEARKFSPDSSASFSNASTVVITESELSSSWLYKNKKEQMNNNNSDPKDQFSSNAEENLPQVHRPRVKSTASERERPKKSSCWCYVLVILAIFLASMAILAGIASIFYMELFAQSDNTDKGIDAKDQKIASEPIRKVGQSTDYKPMLDVNLPSDKENFQEIITHAQSIFPSSLVPANKLLDSNNERRHPHVNPKTGNEDLKSKSDPTTENESNRIKIPNLIPNVVNFFVDSFIPKDKNNKSGDTPKDEPKQNVLLPINNFLFSKNGQSPYSKLFEMYTNIHKTSSGTPQPSLIAEDTGKDTKSDVDESIDSDLDKQQSIKISGILPDFDVSNEQQKINIGANERIESILDENKQISEVEPNQFEKIHSSFVKSEKDEKNLEDKVRNDLSSKNELKEENDESGTNIFDTESAKSLFLKPNDEDMVETDGDSKNRKPVLPSKEISDVVKSINEKELELADRDNDSDILKSLKENDNDNDDVLEMHPLKPSDFDDFDSSFNDHEKKSLDELEIAQTEMPEEHITELFTNLFKNMDGLDLDNELSFDSEDSEEPNWNRPISETAVPGPLDMIKLLNMEQENTIKQSELEENPDKNERQFSLASALERLRTLDITNILPTSRMSTKVPPIRDQKSLNDGNKQNAAEEKNHYLMHLRQLFFEK